MYTTGLRRWRRRDDAVSASQALVPCSERLAGSRSRAQRLRYEGRCRKNTSSQSLRFFAKNDCTASRASLCRCWHRCCHRSSSVVVVVVVAVVDSTVTVAGSRHRRLHRPVEALCVPSPFLPAIYSFCRHTCTRTHARTHAPHAPHARARAHMLKRRRCPPRAAAAL